MNGGKKKKKKKERKKKKKKKKKKSFNGFSSVGDKTLYLKNVKCSGEPINMNKKTWMGQPCFYRATVALSFQIEICNLDNLITSEHHLATQGSKFNFFFFNAASTMLNNVFKRTLYSEKNMNSCRIFFSNEHSKFGQKLIIHSRDMIFESFH